MGGLARVSLQSQGQVDERYPKCDLGLVTQEHGDQDPSWPHITCWGWELQLRDLRNGVRDVLSTPHPSQQSSAGANRDHSYCH